jgi:hypothetical protein
MLRRNKDRPVAMLVHSDQKRYNAGESRSENRGTNNSPSLMSLRHLSFFLLPLPPPLEFVTAFKSIRQARPRQRLVLLNELTGPGATKENYSN